MTPKSYYDRSCAFSHTHPFHSEVVATVRAWYDENEARALEAYQKHSMTLRNDVRRMNKAKARRMEVKAIKTVMRERRKSKLLARIDEIVDGAAELAVHRQREMLLDVITALSGLPRSAVDGPSRRVDAVRWRRVTAIVAWRNIHTSIASIGRWIKRDHTTVLHHIRRFEETPEPFLSDVTAVETMLAKRMEIEAEKAGASTENTDSTPKASNERVGALL